MANSSKLIQQQHHRKKKKPPIIHPRLQKKLEKEYIHGCIMKSKPPKKGPSVIKTLTNLLSTPCNRSCADCRSALVDPSHVYASFCPSLEEVRLNPDIAVAFHDFQLTHRAFAPPDMQKDDPLKFGSTDLSLLVNQRFGGHGVFVCSKCADAHNLLGKSITMVHSVQDQTAWTNEQAQFMKENGGNARSWTVYEAYMPEPWKQRRPNPASSPAERLIFCRAKYEALAFAMPPPGPLSELAWLSILERNEAVKRFGLKELKNIRMLTPNYATPAACPRNNSKIGDEIPNRLIDHFCVVSCSMQLHPKDLDKDLSTLKSPEELRFWPHIGDCFPVRTAHDDMTFPEHLPSFVSPDGCHPSTTQKAPNFFTFVLTQADGDRLYGGCLQTNDENMETETLKDVILNSGYTGKLPQFLTKQGGGHHDIVFFPKCLILLSHHPFFDLFREALLELYRITLVEAPLPIERYISNLCCEVPLPAQGKIKVEFGFTTDKAIKIERPPINQLPMVNFSYRPLFASLSVGNIMVVMGCLMEECQVVLLSQHFGLITPVAEALLSALFPFEWQGLYLPIMPYSMLEILDAPVPFLIGLDSKYLQEIHPKQRPKNVVFVDLDRDVVHLGYDETNGEPRKIPALPNRDAVKLKSALDEAGGSVYLIPNSGIKGCIMSGSHKMVLVTNEERPKYAHMNSVLLTADALGRSEVFSRTDKAYDGLDLADGIAGFQSVHGHMKDEGDSDSVSSGGSQTRGFPRMKTPKFMRNKKKDILSDNENARSQAHLLDMAEPEGFSSADIRSAFLRFFVSTFVNYQSFLLENSRNDLFDEDKFVDDIKTLDSDSLGFLQRVLQTQMFQRFLEERQDNPEDPETRFFDESIIAKQNRSKKTTLAKGGKRPTPFLDDESWKATKTYTPPPPSNQGLPDSDTGYHYGTFPTLDYSLIGRIRPPMMWAQEHRRDSVRFRATKIPTVRVTQQEIVKKAMRPFLTAPGAIAAVARRSAKDLETALAALSPSASIRRSSRDSRGSKGSRKESKESKLDKSGSSLKSSESGDSNASSDRTVSTLTRADTIMMNARRKQCILLDLVIKLQAVSRMSLARKRFKKFRKAVVCMQSMQRENSLDPVASHPLVRDESGEFKKTIIRVIIIQRSSRRFLSSLKVQKRVQAIHTLQRSCRGVLARRWFARAKESAVLIQKHVKARRNRFIFELVRNLISKVQARGRGMFVRRRVDAVFSRRMTLYREQIFLLWNIANVSLSLRTRLWPAFSTGQGFSRLRLAEAELGRMWGVLGIQVGIKENLDDDEFSRLGDSIGIDNRTYHKCKNSIKSMTGKHFDSPTLENALAIVEAERLQIYERLDSKLSGHDSGNHYEEFGIPANEKLKKVCLANIMWTKYKLAAKYVSKMLLLFPELEGSLNIAFHNPSTKGCRRFPKACKISSPPVEKSVWDQLSLEGVIKRHVQEVASIYITKVPKLMAKLDEADERKGAKWSSFRGACMKSYGLSSWEQCQYKMVTEFLAGRYASETTQEKSMDNFRPVLTTKKGKKAKDGIGEADFPDINMEDSDPEPIKAASFPDINMGDSRNDPVKAAGFPEINLERQNDLNLIVGITFPDIDTVATKSVEEAPSKFPDIL